MSDTCPDSKRVSSSPSSAPRKRSNSPETTSMETQQRTEIASSEQDTSVPQHQNHTSQMTFPPLAGNSGSLLKQLLLMGFSDEGKVRHAVELGKAELGPTVNTLLCQYGSLNSAFSAVANSPSSCDNSHKHNDTSGQQTHSIPSNLDPTSPHIPTSSDTNPDTSVTSESHLPSTSLMHMQPLPKNCPKMREMTKSSQESSIS